MFESKHRLSSFSPTGKVFERMLRPVTAPGPAVYNIATAEDLNFPERQDNNESLSPSQINEGIFYEGSRLAGADILDIGNGKEILVFNTSVASTHSLLTVTYDEWEQSFREQAKRSGYEVPEGILIHGRTNLDGNIKPPTHVPLDMVTWAIVRHTNSQTYWPFDINDLTSIKTGNEDIDKFKLELSDTQLQSLNETIVKRNKLAVNTLLDLHNNTLCKAMPFLRQKTKEDLLIGGLSGYHRGDEAKHLDQFEFDHRGKGPMSNPTFHFRITDHFTMEDANILDQQNPNLSFLETINLLREHYPEYFKGSIDFLRIKPETLSDQTESQVLADLMKDPRFSLFDLIKSVDPFGSLAHEYLGGWLQNEFNTIFQNIPHAATLFADYTEDFERELRVSEGVTIKFEQPQIDENDQNTFVATALVGVEKWIGQKLYPMWDDINNLVMKKIILPKEEYDEKVQGLKAKYNLPDEFIKAIRFIKPTEKQLKLLREEEEHSDQLEVQNVMKLDNMIYNYGVRKVHVKENIAHLKKQLEQKEGDLDTLIEILTWMQSGQIFDYSEETDKESKLSQGYNIPGTPGTAITYHFDKEGHLSINIGWVLSTKGLSELWLGTILKRKERRDR